MLTKTDWKDAKQRRPLLRPPFLTWTHLSRAPLGRPTPALTAGRHTQMSAWEAEGLGLVPPPPPYYLHKGHEMIE